MYMIISFKVENFRSIKEPAEFTMRAAAGTHLSDHLIDLPDHNGQVVRSAGFYGPNASGKSNFLKAFAALVYLVDSTGNLKDGSDINCYEPYILSSETKNAPTKFQIEFIVNELRYIYRIEFTKNKITHESLDCFYSKIPSNLFIRDDGGWENIKFGNAFKGGSKKIPFFSNNSYLSKIGETASAPDSVRDVYKFFSLEIGYLNVDIRINKSNLKDKHKREIFAKTTGDFLSLIDTGINSIKIDERDVSHIKFPDGISEDIKDKILSDSQVEFMFSHTCDDGEEVFLEREDESDGTRRLFELTPALLSSFINKRIFIVDEIDHNIHPHLAALILRLFNDSEVNRFGSQLIFSTHNVDLMKPDRMRRDQIWFSEKIKGATSIFCLDDFEKDKVKPSSPFHKWYDEGRFGGVPNINFIEIKNYFNKLNANLEDKEDIPSDDDVFGSMDDLPKFE